MTLPESQCYGAMAAEFGGLSRCFMRQLIHELALSAIEDLPFSFIMGPPKTCFLKLSKINQNSPISPDIVPPEVITIAPEIKIDMFRIWELALRTCGTAQEPARLDYRLVRCLSLAVIFKTFLSIPLSENNGVPLKHIIFLYKSLHLCIASWYCSPR
jgi:hypothetical protein